jgi:hypothetical protein
MKQGALKQALVIGIAVIITGIGCQAQPGNHHSSHTPAAAHSIVQESPTSVPDTSPPADPERQATEAHLLASIIRLTFSVRVNGETHQIASHGTVKDGRYLVTHNHYPVPMSETRAAKVEGLKNIGLYRADGTLLIDMPVMFFKVVYEEDETLVLDFGEGYFDRLGVPSAAFLPLSELPPAENLELAQVDWDGQVAHVDWVTVAGDEIIDGTRVMVLNNGLLSGASGGGVFWNGSHVANNWSTVARNNAAGETVGEVSYAALNSSQVAGDLGQSDVVASARYETATTEGTAEGFISN